MAVEEVMIRLRTQGGRAVKADLVGVASSARAVGDDAIKAGRNSARGFGLITRGVANVVAAAGGLYAFGRAFGFAFGEADEAARVGRQTAAVIESTGGVANVTRRDVEALAGAISAYAGIDDELIQSGENLLLTFTRVRNEVGKGNDIFDQAMAAATDMSASLGTDLRSSVMMLGKALNDPIGGLSALRRAGVRVTAQMREQIKAFVESGDVMSAQRLILREMAREFGGSARAQATNLDKLRVSVANIAEAVGGLFLPTVQRGAAEIRQFIDEVEEGRGTGGEFRDTVVSIAHTAADLWRWIKNNKDELLALTAAVVAGGVAWKSYMAITTVVAALKAFKAAGIAAAAAQLGLNAALIANPIGLVVTGIAALVAGFVVAYKKVGWFRDAVDGVVSFIEEALPHVGDVLAAPFVGLAKVASSAFREVKQIVREALLWVLERYNDIQGSPAGYLIPGGQIDTGAFYDDPRRGYAVRALRGRERRFAERLLQPPNLAFAPSGSGPLRARRSSRTINVNAPLYLDGREIARGVGRAQDDDDMWNRG